MKHSAIQTGDRTKWERSLKVLEKKIACQIKCTFCLVFFSNKRLGRSRNIEISLRQQTLSKSFFNLKSYSIQQMDQKN